ncbi:MAG: hypothetical protein ACXVSE_17345 [Solirubrobacteraceae bacterium]
MSNRNRWGTLARASLTSGALVLAACMLPAASSAAITPASLTFCKGKVSADPGGEAADDPNLLDYRFSCDGGITAYTVLVNQQGDAASGGTIDDYNPSPSVFETDGLTPSPTETITCEGTTPSGGINCNLTTAGAQLSDGYFAQGTIDPIQPYCKHLPTTASGKTAKPGTPAVPQAIVQLVVTDYTGAEDGPFTLGPATACPKVPNVVPTPKPKVKSKKTKPKAKHTAKAKTTTTHR